MSMEWRAIVRPDLTSDATRVFLVRDLEPDLISVAVGFDEDGWIIQAEEPRHVVPTFQGFLFPRDALQAIVLAVKPGPSEGEIRAIREALGVERDRVDRTLRELIERATSPPISIVQPPEAF